MRRLVVAVGLWISCGRSGLLVHSSRDGRLPSPGDAGAAVDTAAAQDEATSDRGADLDGADTRSTPDGPTAVDATAGCSPLQVTWVREPDPAMCPPSATTAACASSDQGAVVSRSAACAASWGAVPFQCEIWPTLPTDQELVVLSVPTCSDRIVIEAVSLCPDRIEVDYVNQGTCEPCDTTRSRLRDFTLPLDSRPVIATGTYAPRPACALPVSPDAHPALDVACPDDASGLFQFLASALGLPVCNRTTSGTPEGTIVLNGEGQVIGIYGYRVPKDTQAWVDSLAGYRWPCLAGQSVAYGCAPWE